MSSLSTSRSEPVAGRPCQPTVMGSFERAVESLARAALLCGVALIAFDVILIITDVLGRSLVNQPLLGTVEIARNTVPLIIFCQAPATILAGRMLRVSALFTRLSVSGQRFIDLLSGTMGLILFAALIADMWSPMLHSWAVWEEEGMAGIKLPLAPIRTVLLVLWVIALLAIVIVMHRTARGTGAAVPVQAH